MSAAALKQISVNLDLRSCSTDIRFKASSCHLKCFCGLHSFSRFPQEALAVKTKTLMCSLSPVFKKAVILVYRENNKLKKKMVSTVSVALIYSHDTNGVFGVKRCIFFFFSPPMWHSLRDDQTNPRSALSHGDSDPFKFRWLIPLSALQVRLGNTAGKNLAHCHIIPTKSLTKYIH